jgi:hypothetical protein
MSKNVKGFGVVEIVLVVVVVGLIGVLGWMFLNKKTSNSAQQSDQTKITQTTTETEQPKDTSGAVSIYPSKSDGTTSKDFYTVVLPKGWSVEKVFEPYSLLKTVGNDKYLISSFVHEGSESNLMQQRVDEGITAVSSVKTKAGTTIHILKTPTTLFLANCVPSGDNCYLQLNGKKLYIHLYQIVPGAQTATNIDYSSASAKEIISDLENIAKSLSI